MDEKCRFCRSEGLDSSSVLYESSLCLVIRNKYPISMGHVLVIPRAHYKDVYEIPETTLSEMLNITNKLNSIMVGGLHAVGVKNVMNNSYASGQRVFHAHMHVIPAYKEAERYNVKKKGDLREIPPPAMSEAYDRIMEMAKSMRI